ncbi:DNase I-like protein [Artomyces pyxidatus]|uniref:DNase I-like protein n=1 Tax=Artomyces pyxidatus TaxID=48021 RepID=A0ACB8SEU9_9AGAM|nr:DNase I-like protein [Artomyces pyxidatus]
MSTAELQLPSAQAPHPSGLRLDVLVLNSSLPTNPGASTGVAFVLNRWITNDNNYRFEVLIPGRAIALTTTWHNDEKLTMLNVYAPNHPNQHPAFWERLQQEWRQRNMPRLDFLMGDFNIVEDPLDRAPARFDDEAAITALREFRTELNIKDAWRHSYPDTRMFIYRSNRANKHAESRLDRIYIANSQTKHAFEWMSGSTTVPTDHHMVSVRFAPKLAPHIGPGRPTFPLYLVNNKELINLIITLGKELMTNLRANVGQRTGSNNPQTLWKDFKEKRLFNNASRNWKTNADTANANSQKPSGPREATN